LAQQRRHVVLAISMPPAMTQQNQEFYSLKMNSNIVYYLEDRSPRWSAMPSPPKRCLSA